MFACTTESLLSVSRSKCINIKLMIITASEWQILTPGQFTRLLHCCAVLYKISTFTSVGSKTFFMTS